MCPKMRGLWEGAWPMLEILTQDSELDLFSHGKVPQKLARLEGERFITILVQTGSRDISQGQGSFERRVAGTGQDQSISTEDRLDGCDEGLGRHFEGGVVDEQVTRGGQTVRSLGICLRQ